MSFINTFILESCNCRSLRKLKYNLGVKTAILKKIKSEILSRVHSKVKGQNSRTQHSARVQ